MRELRTNTGVKNTSDVKELASVTIHNTKYCIPLDHPILNDHSVFYPMALSHQLICEITFAPFPDAVVYSDNTSLQTIKSFIWSWNINAFQVNISPIKLHQNIK